VISIDDISLAAERLSGTAHRTPVLTSHTLDELVGARVFLKAENLQRAGAFKFRGAYNKLATLPEEQRAPGLVAVSSGNHAQAVALAAALHGVSATILMPTDAPASKLAATRAYGAEVIGFDRYEQDRDELLARVAAERALTVVHPFDDPEVMAGQGTVALELLEQAPALDLLVCPVSGGGLIAGCATAVRALSPQTRVVGVEPAAADDTRRSLAAGRRVRIEVPRTIADALQVATPGRLTFEVVRERVSGVVAVSDSEIAEAMRFLFERLKVVAEPAGACALAALLAGQVPEARERIGVVISGGNVDAERFCDLLTARPEPTRSVQSAARIAAPRRYRLGD
jgi:threonine ammonia-lyase medium form